MDYKIINTGPPPTPKKERRKAGRPTEKKKDDYIKARVTKDYKDKVKKFCKENGIKNVSVLVIRAVDKYMNDMSK